MNIFANFDVIFYLSNPRNKFSEQTLFEINTMLYLANLLSIYDGRRAQKWGYMFARNKYGAPISIEIMNEIAFLCDKGVLDCDSFGYYKVNNVTVRESLKSLSKSSIMGWRVKYIEAVVDALLTKPFPKVVNAIQKEPGINFLDSINRTSALLEDNLVTTLYEDFRTLQDVVGNERINIVVPASLWIDYLFTQL